MARFYILRTRDRNGSGGRFGFSYDGDVGVVALNKARARWYSLARQGHAFVSLEHRAAEDDDDTSEGQLLAELPEPPSEMPRRQEDADETQDGIHAETPRAQPPPQLTSIAVASSSQPQGLHALTSLLGSLGTEDIQARLNEIDKERAILAAVADALGGKREPGGDSDFLDEIVKVCRQRGLMLSVLSYEDTDGSFIIEPFNEEGAESLLAARRQAPAAR